MSKEKKLFSTLTLEKLPEELSEVHKEPVYCELPRYISTCLRKYGNTVISNELYQKLGSEGVIYNVALQFSRNVTIKVNNGCCILTQEDKR